MVARADHEGDPVCTTQRMYGGCEEMPVDVRRCGRCRRDVGRYYGGDVGEKMSVNVCQMWGDVVDVGRFWKMLGDMEEM